MLFNSMAFAIFLTVVFFLYWLLPHKFRWSLLLVASYYFYMSWNPKYVVLILLTTIVSYFAAIFVEKTNDINKKRLILSSALIVCLGILFVFKYFNFFSETLVNILKLVTIPLNVPTLTLLLPVGISFYTFQTLSYVIDVYRGNTKVERNFWVYATFISFFPQLVAGPIERADNLLPQIKSEKVFDYNMATYGLKLMAWGFFKKLAIADVAAKFVDEIYSSLYTCSGIDLLVGVFFFTIQIYCDFSGYSDIAIGTSKLLGINLMKNFESPYLSHGIKEFWSRWHISLSTWFRDYVYIPLGGNRCSKLKRDINLFITFLVSGLWHGANWTFVVWGGIHGFAQIIENRIHIYKKDNKFVKVLTWLVVFTFCNVTWIFFRAQTITDAIYVIKTIMIDIKSPAIFLNNTVDYGIIQMTCMFYSLVILFTYDYLALDRDVIDWISRKSMILRWGIYMIIIWSILFIMLPVGTSEFVYFQF